MYGAKASLRAPAYAGMTDKEFVRVIYSTGLVLVGAASSRDKEMIAAGGRSQVSLFPFSLQPIHLNFY